MRPSTTRNKAVGFRIPLCRQLLGGYIKSLWRVHKPATIRALRSATTPILHPGDMVSEHRFSTLWEKESPMFIATILGVLAAAFLVSWILLVRLGHRKTHLAKKQTPFP